MILSPSILSADFTVLGQQLAELGQAGAEYIHIDVMDGIFVPSISFGMPVIRSIRKASDKVFDVHLMITEPERYLEDFAECGADMITFHLEAAKEPKQVIDKIHALGLKAGISIKPATAVSELIPYLDKVDMVLIMSVEPGFGGQAYLADSTEKIKQTRQLISERGLHADIQVDGGINEENIRMVAEAGANVIVAGSSVFRGNITENIKKLMILSAK